LAGLGAKVAVADLDLRSYREFDAEAKEMTAESTVAEVEASGSAASGIECDGRDHQAVEAMVTRVADQWGRVDVLGRQCRGGRGRLVDTKVSTIDPALLDLVVGMNLFGTVYSCNAVAPVMKRQRSGKIVTVSSVPGLSASADGGYAHYGAAKGAIAHYTRYLAQDLRRSMPATASARARGKNAKPAVIAKDADELHGDNNLTKQTALTEKGDVVNGRGDIPNRHDALTGTQPDGRAFPAGEDKTCHNWTSSTQGGAMVGHIDRQGLRDDA
jgi:NAD(P)-dependent dehydrogenase (short-subunit alcohol dehydrogenase family)